MPLETPLLDPIDFIPVEMVASLAAKWASVVGREVLTKVATRAATEELAAEATEITAKRAAREATEVETKRVTGGATEEISEDVGSAAKDIKPPEQKLPPSGTSAADKGLAAGLTTEKAAAAKAVIGDMKAGDGTLAKIWDSVANPGEKAKLTRSNSRRLFNNQRKRFWNAVFDDPKAKGMFEKMGAKFPKRGNAPVLKLPSGEELQMTIDHVIERQTNPAKALDSSNLRISPRRENTVVLRQLHDQDPFQNPARHGWQPFP